MTPLLVAARRRLRGFVRLVFPYGSVRRVLTGPVRGARYVVEAGMGLSYAIGFEREQLAFLGARLRPGMTVYDIGANRGQMALFFSRAVGGGGRVLSFEPAPDTFASLVRNLALNGASNVEPHNVAVGASDGTASFHFESDRPTEGYLTEARRDLPDARSFDVRVRSLDSMVREGTPLPDVMKVDVEGAAPALLRGARAVIERSSPSVYIELHSPEEQAAVRDELGRRGYIIEAMDGQRVADPTASWVSPLWCHRPRS